MCILVIGLTLLNKDKITSLLNNKYTSGLFDYLGSISLHIYMLHYPIAIFVLKLLGPNTEATTYSFWSVFIPATLLTIIFSALLKTFMDMIKENRQLAKAEELEVKPKTRTRKQS